MVFVATLLLLIGLTFCPVSAEDWPQFGGPHRDGRSPASGLMDAWPDGGPTLAWSAEGLGLGYSSVAVVDDRLYTLGDQGDEQLVFALDCNNGNPIWQTRIGPANHANMPGSRSTPTVAQDKLYALGTDGDLACLNLSNGSVVWQRHLKTEFGAKLMLAMGKVAAWSSGDFNADGFVDGLDFIIWNDNKFTSSDQAGSGALVTGRLVRLVDTGV
ncbi:unnamed protein product, partial [marine sediment metagenome]